MDLGSSNRGSYPRATRCSYSFEARCTLLGHEKGNMKKFTIEVSHAAPGQLATIAAELKIMSNGWAKFGPRIMINGAKLQAPSLRISGSSKHGPRNGKPQATSLTRPEL